MQNAKDQVTNGWKNSGYHLPRVGLLLFAVYLAACVKFSPPCHMHAEHELQFCVGKSEHVLPNTGTVSRVSCVHVHHYVFLFRNLLL